MSIKIYDNSVPFYIRQRIYKFIINSNFMIQGWDDSDWADDATNNYIDNHGQEVEVAAPPQGWHQGWQDRWWDWNTSKSWWN